MASNHLDESDFHILYLGGFLALCGGLFLQPLAARSPDLRPFAALGAACLVALPLTCLLLTRAHDLRQHPDQLRPYCKANTLNLLALTLLTGALVYLTSAPQ